MPLLIEYYVVLLLYNILKIFLIKKCPVRTLNFPVKSRLFKYLSDLRCMREFEIVGTFIVLRRRTGTVFIVDTVYIATITDTVQTVNRKSKKRQNHQSQLTKRRESTWIEG